MGLHEIKKLLHNKRNGHQTEEADQRIGEVFANYTSDKGLITRKLKKLNSIKKKTKLNSSKVSDPMKKWTKELNRDFFKGRRPNGQKPHG
jgi:hypothetical protein